MAEKTQPHKKIRAGSISATAWENKVKTKEGKEAVFYTVTIERNYKDKEDNWARTNSYRVNDLNDVVMLAGEMYKELRMKETEQKEN